MSPLRKTALAIAAAFVKRNACLFSLIEFRKLEVDHENDVDPEELVARFKRVVGAFDPTPFVHEESQWNLSLEELQHGMW